MRQLRLMSALPSNGIIMGAWHIAQLATRGDSYGFQGATSGYGRGKGVGGWGREAYRGREESVTFANKTPPPLLFNLVVFFPSDAEVTFSPRCQIDLT